LKAIIYTFPAISFQPKIKGWQDFPSGGYNAELKLLASGMNNETYLSTKQITKKKDSWFPGPHEDRGRTQGHQAPPPRRTQDTGPLITYRLPQRLKLKKRAEFQKFFRQGQRAVGRFICIDWRESGQPDTRLGITASRRYGPSHERNRFKRLVREAFRLSRLDLPCGLDLNIVPRQHARYASMDMVRAEFVFLTQSIPAPSAAICEPQPVSIHKT
jgi:ribonuclease P protein component